MNNPISHNGSAARRAALVLTIAALLLVVGCARLIVYRPWGPPPHARARGPQTTYVYHYYPDLEIYWIVASKQYVVFRDGGWVVVDVRPRVLAAPHSHVVINVDAPKPWHKHTLYKKKYPPGWTKAKRRK